MTENQLIAISDCSSINKHFLTIFPLHKALTNSIDIAKELTFELIKKRFYFI